MPKVDITVQDLVGMISRGELRLPEMQRQYVWTAPKVRDLLDSLYREYPSGSILVWETDDQQPIREMAVQQENNPFQGHKLLLDGQQRLTSLSSIIRGEPVSVRNRQRPIDILFNLEHPELLSDVTEVDDVDLNEDLVGELDTPEEDSGDETIRERMKQLTFVVASNTLAQDPAWIRVTDVFKDGGDWKLLERRVTGPDDPRFTKYSERLARLRKLRDYQYVMHVLQNKPYEEVAEIFVRVNSLGVKLKGSDLALAQITAKWRNSLALFEEFQTECEEHDFSLELGVLIRALVVFATNQSRFKTVSSLSESQLSQGWEKAKLGLHFATNFLRSNATVEDETLLSSPMFLIAIAVIGVLNNERLSPDQQKQLMRWFFVANARGRYSRGSTETILDSDLSILFKNPDPGLLIEPLRLQFGRLTVEEADFEGKDIRSPLFSTAFIAMKRKGAKDWRSNLQISLGHQGSRHFIEAHHIHPKSLLQRIGRSKKDINDMANLAFLSAATNKWIRNRPASDYLPELEAEIGKAELEKHCIPSDRSLWIIENYDAFLIERRRLLGAVVNDLFDQ
jgi:hypothetical protein